MTREELDTMNRAIQASHEELLGFVNALSEQVKKLSDHFTIIIERLQALEPKREREY